MRTMLACVAGLTLLVGSVRAEGDIKSEGKDKVKAESKAKPERPDAEALAAISTVTLKAEVKDGEVSLTWTPANDDATDGVKVVASTDNDSPLYPGDGYVVWLSGKGHTSAVVPNKKAAGKKYFRVCFVTKGDHSTLAAVSNVVEVPAIEMSEANKAKEAAAKAEREMKKAERDAIKAAEKAAKEAEKAAAKAAKDAEKEAAKVVEDDAKK